MASTDNSEMIILVVAKWWFYNFIILLHLLARWPSASPLPFFDYWCGLMNTFFKNPVFITMIIFTTSIAQIWSTRVTLSQLQALIIVSAFPWLLTQEVPALPYNFSAPNLEAENNKPSCFYKKNLVCMCVWGVGGEFKYYLETSGLVIKFVWIFPKDLIGQPQKI